MAILERVLRFIGERQAARWDRFGGPGPVLRWFFRHPWLVTIGLAAILAVALGAVFGVPPFSPLVLVIVLVAPVAPILRVLSGMHDRWVEGRPPQAPDARGEPGEAGERGEPAEPGEPDTSPGPGGPTRTDGAAPDEHA